MISMAGFTRTIHGREGKRVRWPVSTEQRGWRRALFALTGFPGRPAMGGRTGQLELRGEKKISSRSRRRRDRVWVNYEHTHTWRVRAGAERGLMWEVNLDSS